MLIIPELSTNYSYPNECKQYKLHLYERGREIGESLIAISNLQQIIQNGKQLNTVARYNVEDMHVAFSALNQHTLFKRSILNHPLLQARTPIIVYLARIYINPEFRGQGLANEFLKQLPYIIQTLVFAYPLAIAVYIAPQSYLHDGDANIPISNSDVRKMKHIMKHMFNKCGYERPSLLPTHKDCLCWVDPNFS